ncbi:zinc finger protein 594 [Xyrichtys novacula]|uniref:Zinc finger protein 594 n=1 Tax=Xyrichtys novacula TaxID=13765 RepID=A0AAV1F226_XYRNO|nr:zinc finger protein 594 [Xyrichtys novacula]
MDGVSWSTTRPPESFTRSKTSTDTLSRLANFIARADSKHQRHQRPQTSHLAPYACQECDQNFSHAADLLNHQDLKHTLPKPHRCPTCGQEFSLRSSLQLHKCERDSTPCERCHGESRLGVQCATCTGRTSDSIRLQDKSPHLQPHLLDSSPYTCAPCGRGFNQKQALLHHQQAGCSEPPSPLSLMDASGLPDDSPPVSEADSTRSDSSDSTELGGRMLSECEVCSRTFRTEAGLERHKQTNHTEEHLTASEEPQTKEAGSGGASIGVNRGLIKRSKSTSKVLSCRSCDLVFRSTSKLYLHRKEKHRREKIVAREYRPVTVKRRRAGAYPCQVCGKVFLHHLSLRAHHKQHAGQSLAIAKDRRNTVTSNSAGNKTVRAGPGRPGREPRGVRTVTDPGNSREVPEEREQEKEEEEEEQVEEEEEEEEQVEEKKQEEDEVEEEEEEEEEEGDEREFPCPSCVEVFSTQSQLREHVELHQSSVRRRRCSVCSQEMDTCTWQRSKRHRLYHCVPCQQGFSTLDSFLEHCQEHLRARVEEDSIAEGYTLQAAKT